MRSAAVTLEVDELAQAAYVRFGVAAVKRTVAHNDAINLDLDEFGVVIGIEILDLAAEIPFGALVTRYHVESSKVDTLRLLQPNIRGFLSTVIHQPTTSSRREPVDFKRVSAA